MTKVYTVTVRESQPSYDWVLHMHAQDAADAVEKMLIFIRQRTKNMNDALKNRQTATCDAPGVGPCSIQGIDHPHHDNMVDLLLSDGTRTEGYYNINEYPETWVIKGPHSPGAYVIHWTERRHASPHS